MRISQSSNFDPTSLVYAPTTNTYIRQVGQTCIPRRTHEGHLQSKCQTKSQKGLDVLFFNHNHQHQPPKKELGIEQDHLAWCSHTHMSTFAFLLVVGSAFVLGRKWGKGRKEGRKEVHQVSKKIIYPRLLTTCHNVKYCLSFNVR